MLPPRVMTPVQMGAFREVFRLSAPAPWNSDSVLPPRVTTPVQMGAFREVFRLSVPATLNSDSVLPPHEILIE